MGVRNYTLGRAALLLYAASAASPATAQLPPGYSGSSSLQVFADEESTRTLVAFGNCFAREYPDQVLRLMATAPGSREEAAIYRRVFRLRASFCLGDTQLQMPLWMVRGAVVEGLYRQGAAIPADLVQVPPPTGTARTLSGATLCYATAHGDQVRALVGQSNAFSRREYEMLGPMVDDFFRCMVPTDGERTVITTLLRYRLVEALLRLQPTSKAAAPTGN